MALKRRDPKEHETWFRRTIVPGVLSGLVRWLLDLIVREMSRSGPH